MNKKAFRFSLHPKTLQERKHTRLTCSALGYELFKGKDKS